MIASPVKLTKKQRDVLAFVRSCKDGICTREDVKARVDGDRCKAGGIWNVLGVLHRLGMIRCERDLLGHERYQITVVGKLVEL